MGLLLIEIVGDKCSPGAYDLCMLYLYPLNPKPWPYQEVNSFLHKGFQEVFHECLNVGLHPHNAGFSVGSNI